MREIILLFIIILFFFGCKGEPKPEVKEEIKIVKTVLTSVKSYNYDGLNRF